MGNPTSPNRSTRISSYEEAAEILHSDNFEATEPEPESIPFVNGSVLHLNGDSHRGRRRLEAHLFTAGALASLENEVLDKAAQESLRELFNGRNGEGLVKGNLVQITRRIMLRVAGAVIGLGDLDNPHRLTRLEEYMYPLTEAIELRWTTRDHEQVVREGLSAMRGFAKDFFQPAVDAHRETLVSAPGSALHDDSPKDLIGLMLRHPDPGWDDDMPLRESIVFLTGATLTTSTAIGNTFLALEEWIADHPEDRKKTLDSSYLRRASNEALRVVQTAPDLLRKCVRESELGTGRQLATGELVVIDRVAVNRDVAIFGPDAATFNPYRIVPERISPYGIAFGGGRHVCIGRPLVTDVVIRADPHAAPERAMVLILRAMYEAGLQADTSMPKMPAQSVQNRYSTIPVFFGRNG